MSKPSPNVALGSAIGFLTALGTLYSMPMSWAEATKPADIQEILKAPSILARAQKDHRLIILAETLNSQKAYHVALALSDRSVPYCFSLGWYVMVGTQTGQGCIDELGESPPVPGGKPERKGFDQGDWHAIQGFDLLSEGKTQAAGGQFKAAVKRSDSSARHHNNLGAYYALTGEYDEARKQLDQSIEIKSDYAVAYANRAWLELQLNQAETALFDAQKALSVQAELVPALLAAGRASLVLGKTQQALEIAERADKLVPNTAAEMLAGDAYLEGGNLKAARQYYRKTLITIPNDTEALLKVAQISAQLGDVDTAMQFARSATQAHPENSDAHLALGRYLELNRDFRAAQIQYERALELKPEKPNAIYGPLLRVLLTMNHFDEADDYSKHWLQQNTDSAECHYNRAWVESQLIDGEAHKHAVVEYRQALQLDPKLVQAHYNLALLLVKQEDADGAAKELRMFIESSPGDPDIPHAKELLAKLGR